jgi:phosphonate transport system substrate-binding protein
LGASVLAFALAALPLSASALDARFVDADGDLVADAPKDPKQWVDPATLIFAYTPVEDPAVYVKVWEGPTISPLATVKETPRRAMSPVW